MESDRITVPEVTLVAGIEEAAEHGPHADLVLVPLSQVLDGYSVVS